MCREKIDFAAYLQLSTAFSVKLLEVQCTDETSTGQLCILSLILTTPLQGSYYYLHVINKQTKPSRCLVSCPRLRDEEQ